MKAQTAATSFGTKPLQMHTMQFDMNTYLTMTVQATAKKAPHITTRALDRVNVDNETLMFGQWAMSTIASQISQVVSYAVRIATFVMTFETESVSRQH